MANINGTPRTHAASMTPRASVSATTTVARTNAVSEPQAVWPDELIRSREALGKSTTIQLQIRSPS